MIGRKRCFLVNSVSQNDLPSDLNGIISIPFGEPANLQDRAACAQAIAKDAAQLKDIVQREGPSAYHSRVPLLSVDEVFRRERPRSDGGDLEDGQVVVLDRQPWADIGRAMQVRRNMDSGTSYHYFLYFSDDTVEKMCQALQIIAWAGVGGAAETSDFTSRVDTMRNKHDRVLDDLRDLCESGRLRASLMVEDPIVCFRVHNASNPTLAQFYMKYHEEGFVRWAEGQNATVLWRTLPTYIEDDTADRLFLPLKYPAFGGDQRRRVERVFSRVLSRYFPGMETEVHQIFFGSKR